MSEAERLVRSLAPGILDRYEPGEVLGRGAFGLVFRARQPGLERPVVVKVVRLTDSVDPKQRERFHREARILAELDHPNVCRVLDFGSDKESAYLVFPDEGEATLAREITTRRMDRARPEPARVEKLLLECLDGLRAIHELGIVHRDLKPANLVITREGELRIIDFGLATFVDDATRLTATGMIVGTPVYMSPDQLNGQLPDPRDDLYSTGVIFYEFATLENPFQGADLAQVAEKHVFHHPPALAGTVPGTSSALSGVVMRMIAKTREARIASAREAGEALREGKVLAPVLSPDAPTEEVPSGLLGGPLSGRRGQRNAPAEAVTPGFRSLAVPAEPATRPLAAPGPGGKPLLVLLLSTALTGMGIGWLLRAPAPPADPGTGGETPGGAEAPPRPEGRDGTKAGQAGDPPPLGDDFVAALGAALATHGPDVLADVGRDAEEPLLWGARAERVPAVRRFLRWIETGGRPETLDPALRPELDELGSRLADLGLASPFEPFLSASPADGVLVLPPGPEDTTTPYLKAPLKGWMATAWRAADAVTREGIRIDGEAAAIAAGRTPPSLPEGLGPFVGMVEIFRGQQGKWSARNLLTRLYGFGPEARQVVDAWVGPETTRRFELALYAFARAANEPGEEGERASLLFFHWFLRNDHLGVVALKRHSPLAILGGPPRTPAAAFMLGSYLQERTLHFSIMSDSPAENSGKEARIRIFEALLPALAPPDGPFARTRFRRALDRIGRPLGKALGKTEVDLAVDLVEKGMLGLSPKEVARCRFTLWEAIQRSAGGRMEALEALEARWGKVVREDPDSRRGRRDPEEDEEPE